MLYNIYLSVINAKNVEATQKFKTKILKLSKFKGNHTGLKGKMPIN